MPLRKSYVRECGKNNLRFGNMAQNARPAPGACHQPVDVPLSGVTNLIFNIDGKGATQIFRPMLFPLYNSGTTVLSILKAGQNSRPLEVCVDPGSVRK